jgi:hypothetical protein
MSASLNRQDGGWMPGVSVFRRQNGGIVRVSDAPFSLGDDFCSVWHFLNLIPEGAAGWQPKYKYAYGLEPAGLCCDQICAVTVRPGSSQQDTLRPD